MSTMKTSTSSSSKKMRSRRGFMCQSPASTAICMSTGDPRSVVIIPRRTTADNHSSGIDQHSRLLMNKNNSNHSSTTTSSRYSRLPADPHQAHQHQTRQKFNTTSTSGSSTHDHYHKRSSSAFMRDNRGGLINHPPPPPPLPTLPSNFQVVVMRVSLHCQGCAGKVKKHLSKMEGVTSFSIDLEMKRVTVMGHVSPIGVLESISKVKRAEFWTSSNTTTTC